MSNSDMAIEILMLGFASSVSIGTIICVSVIIKRCYVKYVLKLPNEDRFRSSPRTASITMIPANAVTFVNDTKYIEFSEITILDDTMNEMNTIAVASAITEQR